MGQVPTGTGVYLQIQKQTLSGKVESQEKEALACLDTAEAAWNGGIQFSSRMYLIPLPSSRVHSWIHTDHYSLADAQVPN